MYTTTTPRHAGISVIGIGSGMIWGTLDGVQWVGPLRHCLPGDVADVGVRLGAIRAPCVGTAIVHVDGVVINTATQLTTLEPLGVYPWSKSTVGIHDRQRVVPRHGHHQLSI